MEQQSIESEQGVEPRLREIVAQVMGVSEAEVPGLTSEASSTWTSLNHLMLISQVEAAFGITLTNAEIAESTSYEGLAATVRRYDPQG
jgi:acyl carrier protein